jgi:DNA-binding NtrC family response regulator
VRKDVFGRRREGRVLVVQDEPLDCGPVTTKLVDAGYEVLQAEDGQEAIDLLRRGDNPFLVDMILCEVTAPRLGAEAAIRHFRAQYPAMPVIVLTEYPDLDMAVTLLKLGVADYLVPPISAEGVVKVVQHTIQHRSRRMTSPPSP